MAGLWQCRSAHANWQGWSSSSSHSQFFSIQTVNIILVLLREWDGKIAIESRGKAEVSTSTLDNPLHRFTNSGWFRGVTTSGNLPLTCYYQLNQPGVYYFILSSYAFWGLSFAVHGMIFTMQTCSLNRLGLQLCHRSDDWGKEGAYFTPASG
jgi:hypothetical protein